MQRVLRLEVERENVRLTGLHVGRQVGGRGAAVFIGYGGGAFFSWPFHGVADDDVMRADGSAVAGLDRAQREFAFFVGVARSGRAFAIGKKRDAGVWQRL